MKKISIALYQANPTVGDLEGNAQLILQALQSAQRKKIDLLVCPELVLTGYPPEDLLLKPHFVEKNLKALHAIARKVKTTWLILGFVDRDTRGRLYNAAAVLHNGKIVAKYHKACLPNYGVFDEKRYFESGTSPLVFEGPEGLKIGVNICEDVWVTDQAHFRTLMISKPDCVFNLSASPFHANKQLERERILSRAARLLNCPLIYANLVGGQDELVFDGRSVILDEKGKVRSRAKCCEEDTLSFTLAKTKKKTQIQLTQSPFRSSITGTEEILKALELGLRDYVLKNRFSKVAIGLSGGIDSALTVAIAARALGPNKVLGVTMPSRFTSEETLADAYRSGKNLDVPVWIIPIKDIHDGFLKALRPFFAGTSAGLAEENLQARIRGSLLMALSNKFGHLVVTTGNKSEMATGYCTLYGDMAGGFALLKDVPKMTVYALSRLINRLEKREVIPVSTLRRPPTAELRHNQKDEDSLPPYAQLDRILEAYVERDFTPKQIQKLTHLPKRVKEVIQKVDASEFKRFQSPPGVKITPKAFGRDRRIPITNRYKIS